MTRGRAVVATGHAAVTTAALEILRAGGNAFDAAVGAGFASTVAEPGLTSLGGGGFLLAFDARGTATLFDFFVDTPGLGRVQAELTPHFVPVTIPFGSSDQVFHVGRGSIAVPGTLLGLLHVHGRLGRLPLEHVVAPAVALARDGVEVTPLQARVLGLLDPILSMSEEGRARFHRGGRTAAAGDRLTHPALADFMEALPSGAADSLYRGELSQRIEADMGSEGLLCRADLERYRVVERAPLEVRYRGQRLLTNPRPSLGGSLLALSLHLLETQSLEGVGWQSAEHLSRIAALQVEVEALRESGCLEPADLLPDARKRAAGRLRAASGGTTHLCVADREGNVASLTNSNGEGSGYIVPGTGVMLNNMLGEDDLHPAGFHASPPGERVASMMSPSLLLRGDVPRLALGSGGSKRIRSALLQVLSHFSDFDRPVAEAVEASRIHWDGELLQVEPGLPEAAVEALRERFATNLWQERNLYFGGVQALVPGVEGAADPRRGGSAAVLG
jgi:gamma-glutamyltranspeptidase/glutathione hydrolase